MSVLNSSYHFLVTSGCESHSDWTATQCCLADLRTVGDCASGRTARKWFPKTSIEFA